MTKEQLEKAIKYKEYHKEKFNYKESNVNFIEGDINNLNSLDLEEGSFDVIVSNCVINLLQNKDKIFNTIFKLLKEGGEFYFSDVYSDRRINQDLKNNNVLRRVFM